MNYWLVVFIVMILVIVLILAISLVLGNAALAVIRIMIVCIFIIWITDRVIVVAPRFIFNMN